MEIIGKVIKQSLSEQTQQQSKPSEEYKHSEKAFVYVWRGLQSGKFLTKDELVNGTEYKYWRRQLADLTDQDLKAGFEGTDGFDGYLTWSAFRKLCAKPRQHASHQSFKALPNKPMAGDELKTRIAKMREELEI